MTLGAAKTKRKIHGDKHGSERDGEGERKDMERGVYRADWILLECARGLKQISDVDV